MGTSVWQRNAVVGCPLYDVMSSTALNVTFLFGPKYGHKFPKSRWWCTFFFLQERLTALRQDSDWFPNGSARAVADCLHKRVWRERERDLFTHSILLFQSQNLFLYSSGNFHAAFPWRSEREWTARDPGYRFGIRSPLNALGIGFPFDCRVSDAKNAQ